MAFSLFRALALSAVISSVSAFISGFPYESQKVRGVNLGGWLVLEPWITPSLFDETGNKKIVDEWTFGELQDRDKATSTLKQHWDTWITEQDFEDIAQAGLNHVRLPIGYWAFEVGPGEPYISGQLEYLWKAVKWARRYGLMLIVDLHGAPGSQNGFDNSGRRIDPPRWQSNQTNIERTNAILERIASMFASQTSTVSIIAPLNEPAGFKDPSIVDATKQYWLDSYGNIRKHSSNTIEMIHDAFQPLSAWNDFMPSSQYQGVFMDTHKYQIFSDAENQMDHQDHIQTACGIGPSLASFHLPVIVGEWTPASTDCAKYLNGRGVGSRYDGSHDDGSTRIGSCQGLTGKASTFSDDYKKWLRQFWQAQANSYEKGAGWIQWTWKAEEADEWSYQAGLANGWIPQNPTDREYSFCN